MCDLPALKPGKGAAIGGQPVTGDGNDFGCITRTETLAYVLVNARFPANPVQDGGHSNMLAGCCERGKTVWLFRSGGDHFRLSGRDFPKQLRLQGSCLACDLVILNGTLQNINVSVFSPFLTCAGVYISRKMPTHMLDLLL